MNKVWIICKYRCEVLQDTDIRNLFIRMFGLGRLTTITNSNNNVSAEDIIHGIYDARNSKEPVNHVIVDDHYKELPEQILKSYNTLFHESCKVNFWFLEPQMAGAWGIKPALLPYTGAAANEIDYSKINL